MKKKLLFVLFACFVATGIVSSTFITATSYPDGAPSAVSGSPGDNNKTCAKSGCHPGNATAISNAITSNVPGSGYVPGTAYTITATISDPSLVKFGFEISPQNLTGTLLGTMTLTDPTKTKFVGAGNKYITHKSAGSNFPNHTATWSFGWTAPTAGTGNVTFYGAFDFADNNGGASGDITRTSTLTIQEASACNITVTPSAATICKGKKQTLSASGATTYTWAPSTGLDVTTGAVVSAKPTATTTYTVTGDGGACSATVTVTVNEAPTSNFTQGACTGGAVLLTRTGTPTTGVKFKWYKDGVALTGPSSTNATYSATVTGNYKVKVTIIATNCAKTSKEQLVTITCKMADAASQFTAAAYPNPFVKSVSVNIFSVSTEAVNVKLMDFSGRTIREFKNVDPTAPFEINEDIAPGVYFLSVVQGREEKMIKVVKIE